MNTQRFVLLQQLVSTKQQLCKIHRTLALTLCFVLSVNLNFATRVRIVRLGLPRTDTLLLERIDVVHHVARREALFINTHRLDQAFNRRLLIPGIQNLKGFRQTRSAPVGAQKPVTQPVKGAHPKAAHINRHHSRQAREHLSRRFIGKGDRQNALRRHLPRLHQPSNARGQHPRFARTSPRQNQAMLGWQTHRLPLRLIQPRQQRMLAGQSGTRYWATKCFGDRHRIHTRIIRPNVPVL